MKNKISTFLTELPGSAIQKQKNKNKRKEISSDPNEDIILSKKRKYLATDIKPHVITTISQVPAINNKVIKKKEKQLQPASTHVHCIEENSPNPNSRSLSLLETIKKLYKELRNFEKCKNRNSELCRQREHSFEDNLNDLFDIAHASALNIIIKNEDKEFLILQRQKGRPGCMLGTDVKLAGIEKQKHNHEKKYDEIQDKPCSSKSEEDIVGKDLKEEPPNTAGTVISEIEKFAVPNSLPSYRTLFSSLKSKFNSPLPQLIKQRSTSTPIAGSERQKLHFDLEPLTPIKELIPSSLSKQTNIELPFQPITSVPKDKYKYLLTSEKLKLGILSKIPKFCPFCDYVCERMIYHHIETNHKNQLKLPVSTSLDSINKIISNFTKNKKVLVPLQRIVDIMGDYWFNPDTRNIGNILCNLGQITAYGGSWELDHVSDVPNPFEQYIITSNQQSE